MKFEKISLAALLLMLSGQVHANVDPKPNMAVGIDVEAAQEAEALRALETLAKAKIIVFDEKSNKIKLRSDILQRLEAEGKLDQVYSVAGAFACK